MSQSQHPSFLHHTTAAKTSSAANGRKRPPLYDAVSGGEEPNGAPQKRRRTRPRRNASQRSPRQFSRPKTGLSNMCPPLDGPAGAPQLPVLTTRDPRIIERWLEDHVISGEKSDEYAILGFDQESIAKPPWKPERASLPDGPATIQLSTPSSCIIIHLSRCGDGSALHAPDILRSVINNPRIIKVGVGIDDDALELYRWSKESYEDARGNVANGQQQKTPQLWEMTSRFDLGCILPENNSSRRLGIRELAQKILGVEVIKSKKLSMSNWGSRNLSLDQIAYAARDAWVSAAIIERLQEGNKDVFRVEALIEMMKSQRSMDVVDKRAKARKVAKLLLKEMLEREKTDGVSDEAKKKELFDLMDLYRPDQPPTFDQDAVTLPLFH
ncbi:hypothetical protein ACHAXR_010101 [Thalassiosira sp. AJA248-18]